MRVGLNLYHLVPGETGGAETYDRALCQALVVRGVDLTLFVFHEAASALDDEPWAADVTIAKLPLSGRSRVSRVAAEQALAPLVKRHRVDLLHNLLATAPAVPGVPQVTTIHDVIYKRYPETHFGLLGLGLALLVPLAVRRSRRLQASSDATKRDLVAYFEASPERIDVTSAGPGLPTPAEPMPEAEARRDLELGDAPIVLTVSAKRPHKNLERLLTAFAEVRSAPAPLLVVPGYPTPHEETLKQAAGERVRFVGWLPDRTLDALYRAATCVVLPSLAEGFGLPVLEAMVRGTPVACSNTSSLPEVAGDAAVYFDPLDTPAIAQAITRLLDDAELRERLQAEGIERAARFTWDATAEAVVTSYERALAKA